MKKYMVTVTEQPDSVVEIKGSIPWDDFSKFEQKAFKRLAEHLELDGFRKGHIPDAVARAHIKDELVLPDMAELAIQELYPDILEQESIDAIGHPKLSITKLARNNELGFTIHTAVLPHIALPDYKGIAKRIIKENPKEVTEEDVDSVIEDLRQLRAYGHVHGKEQHAHTHTEPLPDVTDEFAKSFGDFSSVAELREKIRENSKKEQAQRVVDKHRIDILDAIIKETAFTVPELLLRSEQEKMLAQIEMDITRSGFSMEAYLQQVNKTKEDLLQDFKPEAQKRAKMQLIINAIAKDANIKTTDEEVEAEAEKFVALYPGAEKSRAKAYADMLLINQKVLSLLENSV